jgi:ankyrin repeat protein
MRNVVDALEKKNASRNDLWMGNSKYSTERFVSDSDSELDTSSFKDSFDSDTFDSRDWLSYDGLNARATNRNDILMEILKAKIYHGADPKTLITHGDRTCLMFAVLADDYDFMKKLVEYGVDVNQTNRFGETALGLAIESKNYDMVKYLHSKGAEKKV